MADRICKFIACCVTYTHLVISIIFMSTPRMIIFSPS